MKTRFAKAFQQTPRAVALLLCFWLSGAFCVLNCHLTPVHAAENVEKSGNLEEKELPACHRKNSSAKKEQAEENKNSPAAEGFNPTPARFCVFANITLESAKYFQLRQVEQAVTTAKLEFPPPVYSAKAKFSFHSSYKPPPLDRGGTYLRCCVFLI